MTAQRKVEVVAGVVQNQTGEPAKLTVDGTGALLTTSPGGGGGSVVSQGARDASAEPWQVIVCDPDDGTAYLGATEIGLSNLQELVCKESTLQTVRDRFCAPALLANPMARPTTTRVGAVCMGYEPNGNTTYLIDCDSSRRLLVVAYTPGFGTTSRSTTAFQASRNVAAFSFTVKRIKVFSRSESPGWIALINKATAAANGDVWVGGALWPIAANGSISEVWNGGETLGSGCQIAFCSAIQSGGLPSITIGSSDCMFTVQGD